MADDDFTAAALQGFGDRQNSWAWSMQWWRGHLYVGTNRAWGCVEAVALNYTAPELFPYPPSDPDVACTPQREDLPLQAEIWRWTPPAPGDTNLADDWQRVYQAPNTVALPGTDKFTARDVGYRGMTVFREPDGTEALYVGSVSPRFLGYAASVPPRILRSTDGRTFEPLPQEEGTTLGDFPLSSFRNLTSYKGRFYIQGGGGLGSGVLLEAEDPAGGNNNFRIVSPPGLRVSAVLPYNGSLYIGAEDMSNGYTVLRTDAPAPSLDAYTPVIEHGGYVRERPNIEILSMQVFNGSLYLGANGARVDIDLIDPAELIRIHPDHRTWDVVVGEARDTPAGWKEPLSGLTGGFGHPYNQHIWRMAVFDDHLYIGTWDSSIRFKNDPDVGPALREIMGFDLYRTSNGVDFEPITTNGFDDRFNHGVRTLEATPYGLFLGTTNPYGGLQIWRGIPGGYQGHKLYLPVLGDS